MKNKEYGSFVSVEEAAAICGYAPETMWFLVENRAEIYFTKRRGIRRICINDARYHARHYPDPNTCLPDHMLTPQFSLHDDGKWWRLLNRSDASAQGKQRYFEGTPCELGHFVKRYTKSGKCIDCCQVANGKPTSKEKRMAKNSSAFPGCNLP